MLSLRSGQNHKKKVPHPGTLTPIVSTNGISGIAIKHLQGTPIAGRSASENVITVCDESLD